MKMRTFLKPRNFHDKTKKNMIARAKSFHFEVRSFDTMFHVAVLNDYLKNP